jgi:glutamate racemase
MDKRPVLFLDSGIGCLPYGTFFHSRNSGEKLICVADRANFPYGTKSKETLITLILILTEKLIAFYDPKILAVACNTASVSSLSSLRKRFQSLPIVGTIPAVKPAVLASKKYRIGVLGTQRTIEDPYIGELARQYGPDCAVLGEAAPELVEFVEHRWVEANKEERRAVVMPWIKKFQAEGVDSIVLACTHFLLLKEEFCEAGGDEIGVYDSVEGISRRIESLLDSEGGRLRASGDGRKMTMVVTGDSALEAYWEKLSAHFGIEMETL